MPYGAYTKPKYTLVGMRKAREKANLSLRELDRKCGIDYSSLSRYESGLSVGLQNADRIAAALGTTIKAISVKCD